MDWIDKKLTAHNKAKSDVQAVVGAADGIFNAIWGGVVAISQYANERQMRTSTNGSPYDRVVNMTLYPKVGEVSASPRVLHLTLAESRRKIFAKWDGANLDFSIEVCDDGVVCLKLDGRRVDALEAARLIMEPFLFEGKSPFTEIL